jgi:ribosomal protein S18 acetylase RimI-like enzyme
MSTEFEILAATGQDAQDFANLTITSNAQDKMFVYVCPHDRNATPAQQSEHLRWRTERIRNRMQSAGTHWFKAVDVQTDCTVGVTGAIAPHCDKSGWINELSEAIDQESFVECTHMTAQKRRDLLGDREEEVWCESSDLPVDYSCLGALADVLADLASMAVHPDYQGRGIGGKLLARICSLADDSCQDVYLEATPAGLKLYQKAGFEGLGRMTLFDGEYSLTCMLRKPVSGS